jgi:PAS domain S-box-containing protein
LVTAIGAVAIRRVSSPLQQLKQVALQITAKLDELAATGVSQFPDSNLDRLANIRSRDEVGQLASSFLKLVTSLHSTLCSLHSTNLQLVQAKEAVEKEASWRKFRESLIRAIHEVSLDGILLVNNEGNVVSHNKRFLDVWQLPVTTVPNYLPDPNTGVSDQPVLSANLERVKDPETFLRRVRELYDNPDASDHCEIELKDGRTLERYSTGLRGDTGEYLGRVWFFRDITIRKQAAQVLHDSEEKFRQLAENIREVFWMMLPPADKILYVSPAYEEIWGRTCASLYQSPTSWVEAVHPDDLERVHSKFAQQIRGDPVESEYRIRTPDGQEKWIRNRTFPIRDQAGQLIRVAGIAEEITERKRYEAELVTTNQALNQAQKMEAVGRLAGGIAHDFNNLLMVIQSYTEMLQDSLPAHDTRRKNTQQIMKATERAASLTGQMLAFSRKQIISPVVLDLNTVVNDTTKMLKRLIGEDIEFRVAPAESLWAAEADPDQIGQVLMNLCVNSRDAMPQGGTLRIATGNVTVADGSTGVPPYVASGEYVGLFVVDTGTGISKEVQERVFEPFFTTKDVGKGTGLGLAMVYGVVKQSGGYVWVESELGQGTCFTIYLPRAKGAVASDKSTKAEVRFQGTETLLVVEDEESLREAICDYLKSLGYTVWAASSGPQAMSIASQQGHIDLLITDVVMPKMSGRELSQMLRNQHQDLKTIHMSGYTDDAVLRHGIHELGTTLLQKPFSLSTLGGKVRDTLESATVIQAPEDM